MYFLQQDDNVKYVFEDSQGNLWLAMDQGISKIEYISPISIYDDRSNLPWSVLSVARHNKELYAGTTRGLFFLTSSRRFRPAAGISSDCWYLLSIADSFLASTDGVFQIDGKNNIKHRVIKNRSYFLLPSKKEPNHIWVGTHEGLVKKLYMSRATLYRKIMALTGESPQRVFIFFSQQVLETGDRGIRTIFSNDSQPVTYISREFAMRNSQYVNIEHHQEKHISGMKIMAFTSPGEPERLGYLVMVDGLKIFYPGNRGYWSKEVWEEYAQEIDSLREIAGVNEGPMELSIIPINC